MQVIKDKNFSLGKNKKLILSLGNKRKHNLHNQNLKKSFSNLALQLKKFHRILEFRKETFLNPYIEHNTDWQREAEKERR